MAERTATVKRDTLETQIEVTLNLDGTGRSEFNTGIPFLEHMLDQVARHGLIDLDIQSLDLAEIIFDLEDEFDIEIDMNAATAWDNLKTVSDVADSVAEMIAKATE